MTSERTAQIISLASGRYSELLAIHNDLIPGYYLLAFPVNQGQPTAEEITEMLELGNLQGSAVVSGAAW